jgi:hypothetical protein
MSHRPFDRVPIALRFILAACLSVAGAGVAAARTADEAIAMQPDALSQSVDSFAFWSGYSVECGDAYRIAFGDPTKTAAAVRHVKVQEFQRCLLGLKSQRAVRATALAERADTDAALASMEAKTAAAETTSGGQAEFMGIRFGVGVGVSYSQDDVVPEAELGAGNVIVATKTETQLPRVIFESHYYGWCKSANCHNGVFGVGPYFGIVAKTDKLISAFSTGAMFGWKDKKDGDPQGFSVGIGALLDGGVKSLADGFEAGKPLPAGETKIRFEEKARWSAILFFTRTF